MDTVKKIISEMIGILSRSRVLPGSERQQAAKRQQAAERQQAAVPESFMLRRAGSPTR